MLAYLQRMKKEEGFTIAELLVVILIIGILAAIAIPMFLNQRKAAIDKTVESDIRNAAAVATKWMVANPNAKIPATTVTVKNSEAGSGTGTTAFINPLAALANKASVPTVVGSMPTQQFKVTSGNTLVIRGTEVVGEYCIYGYNPNGDKAAKVGGYYWDGAAGGLNKELTAESNCPSTTDGKIDVPDDVRIALTTQSDAPVASPTPTAPTAGGGGSYQPPMSTVNDCSVIAGQSKTGTWGYATNAGESVAVTASFTINQDCTGMDVSATDHNWTAETPHLIEIRWQSYDIRDSIAGRDSYGLDFRNGADVSVFVPFNADKTVTAQWNKVELGNPTTVQNKPSESGIYYLSGESIVFANGGGTWGTTVSVDSGSSAPAPSGTTIAYQTASMPMNLDASNRDGTVLTLNGDFGITDGKNNSWAMFVDAGSAGASALTSTATGSVNFRLSYVRDGSTTAPQPAGTTQTAPLDLSYGNRYVTGSVDVAAMIDAAKTDPGYTAGSEIKVYADISISSTNDPRSGVTYSKTVEFIGVPAS